jgi:hypothetical protein
VEPDQIVRLGPSFTPFANKLLEVERAAVGLSGAQISTNYWENVADGGVDAEVRAAASSDWFPDGDSAWQYKRTDLPPKKCREELKNAHWARELIVEGAKYRLVLGVALTSRTLASRRKALRDEATELGLPVAEGTFEVLDANALARWASAYPSLAVSPILRGSGQIARDFESWADSNRHQSPWVAAERDELIVSLRNGLLSGGPFDVRISGVSGVGKTRLIMETFRGHQLKPLVAYIPDAEKLGPELINHLLIQGRAAVLIVDECSARRHEKLAESIPAGSSVKLLSIGEPDSYPTRARQLRVDDLSEEALDAILKESWPRLWPEARRFIATISAGNVRTALIFGEKISAEPEARAHELIQGAGISDLLAPLLGGGDFLAAAVLATFRRIGWDGELSSELEQVSDGIGIPLERLRNAGQILEDHGFLERHGRYRSVAPHPVAVFLAGRAWQELGDRLVEVLPRLTEDLAYAFFQRAADIGEFEPTHSAISRLLDPDGPFGTLEALEAGRVGRILTQIAIVAPDETLRHLTDLIQGADLERLAALRGSRRDLVWTLEKLVWHSRTFADSADNLLALARAETETWANNATGVWTDLFGALLPGTAAKPEERLDYLRTKSTSPEAGIRRLVVKAADKGLEHHEMITVSGELQGGVLVEPRGAPRTFSEVIDYKIRIVELLAGMLSDAEVIDKAESTLIEAIHPYLTTPRLRDAIAEAIRHMRPSGLQKVRAQVEHLASLFERVETTDDQIEGLQEFRSNLPPADDPFEDLEVVARLQRWDFGEGELKNRVEAALRALDASDRGRVLDLMSINIPAAWELGHAIATVWGPDEGITEAMVNIAPTSLPAVTGYLWGLHAQGNYSIFDDFLESDVSARLAPNLRVALAVRGPATRRGIERVLLELEQLTPADGASAVFGWHRELSAVDTLRILTSWTQRIRTQQDYNAVVDIAQFMLHDVKHVDDQLREQLHALVMMRGQYPGMMRESSDWARLVERLLPQDALEITTLIFDLIESGSAKTIGNSSDRQILERCISMTPVDAWRELVNRIEARSWVLILRIRGWLINNIPVDVVKAWVGTNLERAHTVASIAAAGGDEPTPIARFLLDKFGKDDSIAGSLAGEFISGFWWGNESDRIAGQIKQLQGWLSRSSEPAGVQKWARTMIRDLEAARLAALQREAEGRD